MPIALIPPGEDIPVKRGRGRPPGAKNREKPASAPEVPEQVEPEPVAVEPAPVDPEPAPVAVAAQVAPEPD